MQKLTVCSLATCGAVLVLGACHNRPGVRSQRDRDGDHDEHVDERNRGDLDHDEGHEERREPDMGAGRAANKAVDAIGKARCEREKRCENIGADKSYASMDACLDKIRSEWAVDLNRYECPHGIVTAQLDQCLAHVRAEECGNPLDTLSRIAQCDADDICDGD
jgi:hypothetical protein